MAGTDWARVIGDSIERATPLTRSIFAGPRSMTASEVLDFLQSSRMAEISTVSPSGIPHIASVAFILLESKLYFRMAPHSALHRNLRHNPLAAVAVVEPPFRCNVFIQGSVRFLSEESDEIRIVRAPFLARFGHSPEILGELIPNKVFAHKA